MEIASGLIKLKPNSNEKVEKWRSTLSEHLDESLATLRDEGVEIESWFRVEIEGQEYLLWYMRAESIQRAFEVSQKLKHPIDKFHYELLAEITAENGNLIAKPLLNLSI
ncbi:MAG: hypothetical protein HRT37_23510 [Alteromonadaceae bacterium]|nr:hypothetical protein [Alteromonadaceae bacterium]